MGAMFFNALKKIRLERHAGFSVAPLGFFRGTKLAYFGFISDFTLKLVETTEGKLTYKAVSGRARKYNVVNAKYLRKFVFDTMTSESLNIPESVADFIEGRTPKTIGARHYMNLKRKAIRFYPRYAEYVRRLRRRAGLL